MSKETLEQQMKDSDMIIKQLTTSNNISHDECKRMIAMLYVPDMTISRSGISHAMKRIDEYYSEGGE